MKGICTSVVSAVLPIASAIIPKSHSNPCDYCLLHSVKFSWVWYCNLNMSLQNKIHMYLLFYEFYGFYNTPDCFNLYHMHVLFQTLDITNSWGKMTLATDV